MDFWQWLGGLMTDATFWTAVQGVGTLVAAVAALVALIFASRQLGELIRSNRLLASSNDEMSASNVALMRPYVQVDFHLEPTVTRLGSLSSASVYVEIRNHGKTAARNVRFEVDSPFHPLVEIAADESNWARAVEELNRYMTGKAGIPTLNPGRSLKYYLDSNESFLGKEDEPLPTWSVKARYEDAEGRTHTETSVLNLEAWRMAIMTADPAVRSVKNLERIAMAVEKMKAR